MGHEAFGVDLAALQQAEQGVRDAVAEIGEEGMGMRKRVWEGSMSVGHDGLAEALGDFGARWEWGVRYLVDDGVDTADALSDTRAWYQKVDDEAIGLLKDGLQLSFGDPTGEMGQWSEKSWSEIRDATTPDYSVESFVEMTEQSGQRVEQVTGWDVPSVGDR
ncbi:hypothetical protein GIY23_09250 [Allosaccharopolyspora coralli]|uniref:Uncharacterized protein n=1 Tax=Allosaccharopolyspora coralli TaxID=2665642 RepID=A0A5Q3Q766_9PSEU|nr:hypothetical protein [Allosaccharopolyspora coralli]QGK69680.1 hypothetical protein GIY23_09250 [Allosaccharopolyspora coralli]